MSTRSRLFLGIAALATLGMGVYLFLNPVYEPTYRNVGKAVTFLGIGVALLAIFFERKRS
jgi:peptidoglycan/LPS O-acetylase OafA/YrhL